MLYVKFRSLVWGDSVLSDNKWFLHTIALIGKVSIQFFYPELGCSSGVLWVLP